jgi:hypothetical protein
LKQKINKNNKNNFHTLCRNTLATHSFSVRRREKLENLPIPLQVDLHLNITSNFSQMESLSQKASWSRETAKQFPRHVSIFRGASLYARLAQPDALHELVHARPAPSYSLETSTDAFKVTQYGGIIYVSDVTALYEAPSSLKWVFKLPSQ